MPFDFDVVWQPQPGPQHALVHCPIGEVFYGGARGGGKTDGVLGKYALKAQRYGAGFNGIFFRRELPMLDDAIERSQAIYAPLGGRWNDQKKTWRFPGGGRLRFRPLERAEDAGKYQGQNVTDACVEEAGNYPDPTPIDPLNGILRSAAGVPIQLILTGNPGGPGQLWIKGRYIDPAPRGMKILARRLPNGAEHRYVFIPSKLTNNQLLMRADPSYVNRLYLVGSEALVKAWLDGDWNVVAGAFFDCWSTAKHVIEPFVIPKHWTRFGSFDWGSAKPFSYGMWAISDGSILPNGRQYPAGAMIRYREWYGASSPNVGLKMVAEDVAKGIKAREGGDEMTYRVADPACFKVDGGPSHAERMHNEGVNFRRADNSRVAGWDQFRGRLVGDEDSGPMLYVFATCTDFIRTVPALQHDPVKAEDVDTDGEDHAGDEGRYACMSRPYTKSLPKPAPPVDTTPPTLNDLWKHQAQQRSQRL